MKKLVISLAVAVSLGVGALVLMTPNECGAWDCPPKKCYFDTNCGSPGCFCYKGSHEIEGTCVSE